LSYCEDEEFGKFGFVPHDMTSFRFFFPSPSFDELLPHDMTNLDLEAYFAIARDGFLIIYRS